MRVIKDIQGYRKVGNTSNNHNSKINWGNTKVSFTNYSPIIRNLIDVIVSQPWPSAVKVS